MSIYVSTTFHGVYGTKVEEVINILNEIEIDGIELGSTHSYDVNFKEKVQTSKNKNFLVHNYCPPAKDELVLNIASMDDEIRNSSLNHMKSCIDFAESIGATIYTFHPGFLADAISTGVSEKNYDFNFSKDLSDKDKAKEIMLQSLNILCEHNRGNKLRLAIETEGSFKKSDVLLMQTPEEYAWLKENLKNDIGINLNLAHSSLAAKTLGFDVKDFIRDMPFPILACEVSHCDLIDDQHKPLEEDSYLWDLIPLVPQDIPYILEFRNATKEDLQRSVGLLQKTFKING